MLAGTMRLSARAALALCIVSALAGSALLPATAAAELSTGSGGGIAELAAKAEQEEATATTTTSAKGETETSTSSSLPSGLLIAAVAAAALVLGGIAFVIVRDARSVAPVVRGIGHGQLSQSRGAPTQAPRAGQGR